MEKEVIKNPSKTEYLYKGKPSRRILFVSFIISFGLGLLSFLILLLFFLFSAKKNDLGISDLGFILYFIPLICGGAIFMLTLNRQFLWVIYSSYQLSEDCVSFRRGLYEKSVSYSNIKSIAVGQSIFEKMIGLKSLLIHTSNDFRGRPEIIFYFLNDVNTPKEILEKKVNKKI